MQRDLSCLADILNAANMALNFVEDMSYSLFIDDAKTQAAVIREFEIIGEAAGRVSEDFVSAHPDVPWRQMVSMRNRLIHGYDDIDLEIVWRALHVDIPSLVDVVTPLVPQE